MGIPNMIPAEQLKIGNRVLLQGKTRHGKNRLNQHGAFWEIKTVGTFRGQPAVSLQSEHKTEGPKDNKGFDSRWVLLQNDPNFLIFW